MSPATPTGCSHFTKKEVTGSACSSKQTNGTCTTLYRNFYPNSTGTDMDPQSLDKQLTTTDVKNPSIVKIAPFSHQPSPNCSKSPMGTSSSSNSQIKPEGQVVSHCIAVPSNHMTENSGSQESTGTQTLCPLALEDGIGFVFTSTPDGQLKPICKTICSCQLRQRALKYVDKGKSKDDSIVIDSDEEDEKKDNVVIDSVDKQGIAWLDNKYFY